MKTFLILFTILAACGSTPSTNGQPDGALAPDAPVVVVPDAQQPDAPVDHGSCAFVCYASIITPTDSGPFQCGGETACIGPYAFAGACSEVWALCNPEPYCSEVWTITDRLECEPIRSQDGSTFIGRTNNCNVIHKDGTWQACVTAAPVWYCNGGCPSPDVVDCPDPSNEACTCTKPNGDSYTCISSV